MAAARSSWLWGDAYAADCLGVGITAGGSLEGGEEKKSWARSGDTKVEALRMPAYECRRR